MTTEKILSAITKAIEQSPVPVGGVLVGEKLYKSDAIVHTDMNCIDYVKNTKVRVYLDCEMKSYTFALLQLPITITE